MNRSSSNIPRINPLYRLQYEKAQDCMVLLFPEGMVKLNGSAGLILEQVDGKNTIEDICQHLQSQFPNEQNIIAQIQSFLAHAHEKQWIAYD